MSTPATTSLRVVHSAIRPRPTDEERNRDAEEKRTHANGDAVDPRGDEEENAAVQRNGGGGVTRGVARVDGKALEALDLRPVAFDDQGRHAVGPGLDGDHEHDEGGRSHRRMTEEGHERRCR